LAKRRRRAGTDRPGKRRDAPVPVREARLPATFVPRAAFPASMEAYFKSLTLWLAAGSEAAAALVIGLATVEATLRALWLFVKGGFPWIGIREHQDDKEKVRLRLGRWLAVALEFELAADVLRTAVAPTWNEIGQLAAIVVLRTLLNYFLQKEIDKAEARDALRISRGEEA
jgi:uncharacterized membrane protein